MDSSGIMKCPIVLRAGLETELARLTLTGIHARRAQAFDGLHVTELVAADLDALVSLAKYDDVDDLACGYLTGPARATLAARMIEVVHAVPAEVLHALARRSEQPEVRYAALKVAGQAHADPQAGSAWDEQIARTIAAAMEDAEGAIRLEAALVAIRVNPRRSGPILRGLLKCEKDPIVRDAVEDLIPKTGAAGDGPADTHRTVDSSLRLAFPSCMTGHLADKGCALDAISCPPTTIEVGEGVRLFERSAMAPRRARLRALVDEAREAACVSFDGDDAAAFALDAAEVLHLIPIPFAVELAREGPTPEVRVRTVLGLAMAASSRVLPDGGTAVQRLMPLLEALSEDAAGEVREVAIAARALLAIETR